MNSSKPTAQTTKSSNQRCVGIDSVEPALLEQAYYHGVTQCSEVQQRIHKEGDFLLCIPEEIAAGATTYLALAVMSRKRVRYCVIGQTEKRCYHIGAISFDSIPQLVEHYQRTGEALNTDIPTMLKNPIPRPNWVIAHSQLVLGEELGRGEYGRVYKAFLRDAPLRTIAVKQFNVTSSASRTSFLEEAKVMKQLKDPNVVALIGVASQKGPLMLLLEFCGGGCLLTYLRAHAPTTSLTVRFKFTKNISSGLRYLESKGWIHRDVAARNCFLTETLVCKIGGFGLSLKVGGMTAIPSTDRCHIKWMAPEALKYGVFSLKSDVWAFGVLLCEIFTQGIEPYPEMTTKEVRERLIGIEKFRMQMPFDVPPVIERLIERCWEEDPQKRPTIRFLHNELMQMLKF